MVGSEAGGGGGGGDRRKEAVNMIALHDALRSLCLTSDWTYSVFWTIRPRPRVRGGYGCHKPGDDNGSLMLMWEDGFCRGTRGECFNEMDKEDPVRKAFSKMSIQLYNYGEGLMGKVASDKCHKWVFKEPTECEQPDIANYWPSSFDALPTELSEQFDSGIQTIAVIQAGHGLLQLGSCKVIPEDLHFVLRMRQIFESLGYQPGFYLSQLFSSTQNASSPLVAMAMTSFQPSPSPSTAQIAQNLPQTGLPPSSDDPMVKEQDIMIKWPRGLSFLDVISGRMDETKLLLNPECITSQSDHPNEILNMDSHTKIDGMFKRSFTLPARIPASSTLNLIHSTGDYTNEPVICADWMETFID